MISLLTVYAGEHPDLRCDILWRVSFSIFRDRSFIARKLLFFRYFRPYLRYSLSSLEALAAPSTIGADDEYFRKDRFFWNLGGTVLVRVDD